MAAAGSREKLRVEDVVSVFKNDRKKRERVGELLTAQKVWDMAVRDLRVTWILC